MENTVSLNLLATEREPISTFIRGFKHSTSSSLWVHVISYVLKLSTILNEAKQFRFKLFKAQSSADAFDYHFAEVFGSFKVTGSIISALVNAPLKPLLVFHVIEEPRIVRLKLIILCHSSLPTASNVFHRLAA